LPLLEHLSHAGRRSERGLLRRQAEDLWGLREDETVGQHFLNLDSGPPVERLRPLIRDVVVNGEPHAEVRLPAINRRGRSVELRVTVTPLNSGGDEPAGALLLMEQSEAVPSSQRGDAD
jgi:two-component system CheB/CheR fusion protein